MSRPGGATKHVLSRRGRGAFDNVEAGYIYSGIRAGISRGWTDLKIADSLGISERTVARYRTRNGLVNPRRPNRGERAA